MSTRPSETSAVASQSRWFTEEVQPHESRLRAWLCARFPTLNDLDDIVQDTYLRVMRAKDAGRIRRIKPYLYSTARNAALDRLRHERVISIESMAEKDESHVLDSRPDALEQVTHADELALLAEAVQMLPPRCREVLILRKLHGLSQKEIAAKLGISEYTVAAQASAGMQRCVEFFREKQRL